MSVRGVFLLLPKAKRGAAVAYRRCRKLPVLRASHSQRPSRVGAKTGSAFRTRSASRRRTQEDSGQGRDAVGRLGEAHRADDQRRSGSGLRWTCKSLRKLAAELQRNGHHISYPVVGELLHKLGYSLQANRKTKEGHPIGTATHNSSTSTRRCWST